MCADPPLVTNPCQNRCAWHAAPPGARSDDPAAVARFVCRGCGTQWQPGVGWTPVDRDGTVPAQVRAALAQ
jgi:hypothetical protein